MRNYTTQQGIAQDGNSAGAGLCQARPFADKVDADYVTIVFPDNHILRYINESTGEISRVRRPQGRIGQTFTGPMGGCEVVQHR